MKQAETRDESAAAHAAALPAGTARRDAVLLGGLALLLIAVPYAGAMNTPDLVWAYQAMALVPVLRSFSHLGLHVAQRDGGFAPYVLWTVGFEAAALASLAAFYFVFDDWRMGFATIFVQQTAFLVLSHVISPGPYRLGWDPVIVRRALAFGLPLMVNGLVMYAIVNGDRFIIANQIGLEALAAFSIAFSMSLIPASILARAAQYVFMPGLARVQDSPEHFVPAAALALQCQMALGVAVALGFAVAGYPLIVMLYGQTYAEAGLLLGWMGLQQGLRSAREGPSTVAMSRAATGIPLWANMARLAALPFAFWAVAAGGPLLAVVWIAALGELAGFGVALALLTRRFGPLGRGTWISAVLFLAALAAVAAHVALHAPGPGAFEGLSWTLAGPLLVCAAAVWGMGDLRRAVPGRSA